MQQINWLTEFLLLGLITGVPFIFLLDIIDPNITESMLEHNVLVAIFVLPYAYVLGIMDHVVARWFFDRFESKIKLTLFKEYKDSLDQCLIDYLISDKGKEKDTDAVRVKEAFRRMRRFLASYVPTGFSELNQPRAVLRATRGAIIPLVFLGLVCILWGVIRKSICGIVISPIFLGSACLCFIAFLDRSKDYERDCITLFYANKSVAREKLCERK